MHGGQVAAEAPSDADVGDIRVLILHDELVKPDLDGMLNAGAH